jgi:putative ABC transport system permease protein
VTVWTESQFTLSTGGDGIRQSGEYVDPSYLSTLGLHPQLGRDFRADEERGGMASHVAILSDDLWQQMFNADPAVVDRIIEVDGVPFTIARPIVQSRGSSKYEKGRARE